MLIKYKMPDGSQRRGVITVRHDAFTANLVVFTTTSDKDFVYVDPANPTQSTPAFPDATSGSQVLLNVRMGGAVGEWLP